LAGNERYQALQCVVLIWDSVKSQPSGVGTNR